MCLLMWSHSILYKNPSGMVVEMDIDKKNLYKSMDFSTVEQEITNV